MTSEYFNFSAFEHSDFPIIVSPKGSNDIWQLTEPLKALIEQQLEQKGAILFRGFNNDGAADFAKLVRMLTGELLEYVNGSTPRTKVEGEVYTSTEYPPERKIVLHNEMAYSTVWPTTLWFYCHIAPATGGATPLADSHKIYQDMPENIRDKVEQHGIKYIRNYRPRVDLSWQQTFNTENKQVVEQICRDSGIGFSWNNDELKTWQLCQGTTKHPKTGQPLWFNQAHLFHCANMDPALREALLGLYGEQGLPRNAIYGNGDSISDEEIKQIMAIVDRHTIRFDWQKGDLLLVDNMLVAHGREPFTGDRKVLVAMNGQHSDPRWHHADTSSDDNDDKQQELLL